MARYGDCDFSELMKIREQLNKLTSENSIDILKEKVIKTLAIKVLNRVIKRTPVGVYPSGSGKTGGTLRRGWKVGKVKRVGDDYEIEIYNDVEYASYVEHGHRTANHKGWVNGKFMLTITMKEIERDAPKIIEQRVSDLLRRALDD